MNATKYSLEFEKFRRSALHESHPSGQEMIKSTKREHNHQSKKIQILHGEALLSCHSHY
jgi:cupin superfamily acireductone dioxygenase involved in methionine salvage